MGLIFAKRDKVLFFLDQFVKYINRVDTPSKQGESFMIIRYRRYLNSVANTYLPQTAKTIQTPCLFIPCRILARPSLAGPFIVFTLPSLGN